MTTIITADNGTVTGSAGLKHSADSSGILQLATGSGTVAVTIDAAQNVGLGTTPSTWYSTWKVLQTNNGFIGNNPSQFLVIGGNHYADPTTGNYNYKADGYATQYQQTATGTHFWRVAPSGLANAPITFNTAMTLDNGGNLGLGVTPSAWGTAGYGFRAIDVGNYGALFSWVTDTRKNVGLACNAYLNSSSAYVYKSDGAASSYRQWQGTHEWHIAGSGTAGATVSMTQAMTLDASGNLAVGSTSSSTRLTVTQAADGDGIRLNHSGRATSTYWKLSLSGVSNEGLGLFQYNGSSEVASYVAGRNYHIWNNNGSQVMGIDTSGNLLLGTTSTVSGSVKGIQADSVDWATTFRTSGAGGNGLCAFMQRTVSTGGFIAFQYGSSGVGTAVGSITTNGTSTTYSTSSDYRLKENVQPMTGALARIAALKPVTYTWKVDGSEGEGFIAHELQEVVPDAVTGEKDGTRIEQYEISPAVPATFDEEGNELTPAVEAVMGEREVPAYQGIDTSFLVATLTAAIQEQQAIIETLKADVAALKGQA